MKKENYQTNLILFILIFTPISMNCNEQIQKTNLQSLWIKLCSYFTIFSKNQKASTKNVPKKDSSQSVKEQPDINEPLAKTEVDTLAVPEQNAHTPTNSEIKQKIRLSRTEALERMKKITDKLFDDKDTNHITYHLQKLKIYIQFLDEIQDKKLIAAIHFLIQNQHRSSIVDTAFWIQSIKKYELNTTIPMNSDTSNKSQSEKLMILRKKMIAGN